jgi:hypothetical protein
MLFSQYRDIFGKSGEGVHSYRFGNVAIVDYLGTLLFAVITSAITDIPLTWSTLFWIVLSIVLHWLFGVDTSTQSFVEGKKSTPQK